jgi:glycosyltransferase involved in cell wall biosynthesis
MAEILNKYQIEKLSSNSGVSFVIPAYNCENTLTEAVESIFNGNFESGDEVIIVNDSSTDDTEKRILDLKKKYSDIISLKNKENKGCPASRNIGIGVAKNPLIFNLDSDNVLVSGSVKKLKEYLVEQNADMAAFSEDWYFQKNIKKVTHKWVFDNKIMTLTDFLAGLINPGPGGNFLYTKKSWQKVDGYWEYGKGLHEAWGFTLKQLASGDKFVILPNSFYFHRYGHNSLFVSESKKDNESLIIATKMIMNFIELINEDDAEYIRSGENWFDNLSKRPIRLKNGEIGISGHKVILEKSNSLTNVLKKNSIVMNIYRIYKKIK